MTYLAKCPNGCASFKGDTGKVWVKIQQDGYDASKDPPWASKRLPTVNSTWSATIPKSISSGEYLLRHEILGLQRATETGRAQFYVRFVCEAASLVRRLTRILFPSPHATRLPSQVAAARTRPALLCPVRTPRLTPAFSSSTVISPRPSHTLLLVSHTLNNVQTTSLLYLYVRRPCLDWVMVSSCKD